MNRRTSRKGVFAVDRLPRPARFSAFPLGKKGAKSAVENGKAAWEEIGQRVDFHPTGAPDYPLLLVGSDGIARLTGDRSRADRVSGHRNNVYYIAAPLGGISASLQQAAGN